MSNKQLKRCCRTCYWGFMRSAFEIGRRGFSGYLIECRRYEKNEDYKSARDTCKNYKEK